MITIQKLPRHHLHRLVAIPGWAFDIDKDGRTNDVLIAVRERQIVGYLTHRGPKIILLEARHAAGGRTGADRLYEGPVRHPGSLRRPA